VYKSLVVKPSGGKQPRTSNARRKIVDRTYNGTKEETRLKVKKSMTLKEKAKNMT
jgi:hypothetical protein